MWTYLNYVRGRTFKRCFEPKISGTVIPGIDVGTWIVFGTAQVENIGLSKIDIEDSGTAILAADMIPGKSKKGSPTIVEMEIEGGVLGIFERHRWIEPGETIEESFAVPLSDRNNSGSCEISSARLHTAPSIVSTV